MQILMRVDTEPTDNLDERQFLTHLPEFVRGLVKTVHDMYYYFENTHGMSSYELYFQKKIDLEIAVPSETNWLNIAAVAMFGWFRQKYGSKLK